MKKFFTQFFVTLTVLLGGIMLFNYCVDPFYHYREPKAPLGVYMYMPVYQTAGAAEHFTYDSAIVGTSMTENFRASWFEEMGLHTVKLSYSGARSSDIKRILNHVFASRNDVQLIVMDINDYQLTKEPEEAYTEPPAYLEGDEWWEDAEYLINNDVFWMSVGRCLEAVTGNWPDIDEAYTWEDPALFSEERVKEDYRSYIWNLEWRLESGLEKPYDREWEKVQCEGNLANILPIVEEHPDTEFVVYFPPYSIYYWGEQIEEGSLSGKLDLYRTTAEKLLQYDNVRVFYFQDEKEIITNLSLYRDVCHHSPDINRYIFECIRDGKNELTEENMDGHFEAMYQIALDYPYDEVWE